MNWRTVKGTREGLLGKITSCGLEIRRGAIFVALPSFLAKWKFVLVRYRDTMEIAQVLDTGPHYIDDDDYVFGGARPKAESDGSNGAGIDLSDGLIRKMGLVPELWTNPSIDWKFITQEELEMVDEVEVDHMAFYKEHFAASQDDLAAALKKASLTLPSGFCDRLPQITQDLQYVFNTIPAYTSNPIVKLVLMIAAPIVLGILGTVGSVLCQPQP